MANSANPEINKKIATSALGTLVIATVFFYLGDRYAETLVTYPGQIFDHLSDAFLSMWQTIKDAPFALDMTSNSLLFGGACFLIIWMIWLRYVAFIGNYRSGEESGSARWGTVKEGKKFKDLQTEDNNLLFTKNFGLALHRPKFDPEYDRNLNVLVVGGSGSGKTFTTQVLALRMREKGVQTFIIAPLKGKEFLPLCEKVGGSFIEIKPGSGQNINIMEIRKKEEGNVYDDDGALVTSGSILAQKIQQLLIFFKLIIPDMTPEEVQYVDDALLKTYGNFGITHKNKSLLDPNDKKKYRKMPILSDVYSELEKMGAPANRLCRLLTRYTTGSASSFNAQTNVNLNNKFVVLDVSDAQKDFLPVAMFLALDYVWDKCKENRNVNKCVFIDETWRLVCSDAPIEAANFVVEIFRTIRGFGGSAVAATQNIADFFSAGIGTAIIGNAKIKMILRSEKEEANAIADAIGLTDEELKRVKTMDRGTCLLTANENHIFINVKATDTEEYLITTDPKARAAAKRRIEQKRTCAAFRR